MNGYEKILKIMRNQTGNLGGNSPKIAVMLSENSCSLGTLSLDADDLLIASHLKGKLAKGDDVLLQKISEETYVIVEKVVEL